MENITKHRTILKFPSDEDLNGAAAALVRLQDTYNLETSSVARGELNGIQYRYYEDIIYYSLANTTLKKTIINTTKLCIVLSIYS